MTPATARIAGSLYSVAGPRFEEAAAGVFPEATMMSRRPKYSQTRNDRDQDRVEWPVRDRLALPNFWEVYAEAKYQGRDLRGMRDLLVPPASLAKLGSMLVDLCECAWRSGIKPHDLMAAAKGELRRRRK